MRACVCPLVTHGHKVTADHTVLRYPPWVLWSSAPRWPLTKYRQNSSTPSTGPCNGDVRRESRHNHRLGVAAHRESAVPHLFRCVERRLSRYSVAPCCKRPTRSIAIMKGVSSLFRAPGFDESTLAASTTAFLVHSNSRCPLTRILPSCGTGPSSDCLEDADAAIGNSNYSMTFDPLPSHLPLAHLPARGGGLSAFAQRLNLDAFYLST